LAIPVGVESDLKGVIDIVKMKAIIWDDEDLGAVFRIEEIPQELLEEAKTRRAEMLDIIATEDEEALNYYLEHNDLPEDVIKKCIRKGTINFQFVPVICGSAFKNKGVQLLLDCVIDYLPSPEDVDVISAINSKGEKIQEKCAIDKPFCGLVFKLMSDQFVGSLVFVRIYSGKLEKGSSVLNCSQGEKCRIGRILLMHASEREDIDSASMGDIIAIAGLNDARTGDTLCAIGNEIILERMTFPEPVVELSIEPVSKADQEKLGIALEKLIREDPSFQVSRNEETAQTIIKGMGELQLEIIVDRLKHEHKVNANVGMPQVAYRETLQQRAEVEYVHKKQSGGAGQFAKVNMVFEPLTEELVAKYSKETAYVKIHTEGRDKVVRYIFVNNIKGGAIPSEFIPGVEKGVKNSIESGILADFPVFGFVASLNDGQYHDVDSSMLAFELAARAAFRDGMRKANICLLEPIMTVENTTPSEYRGTIEGDLSRRRGIVNFTDYLPSGACILRSHVPLSEMFGYVDHLRSISKGRASSSMHFSNYAKVPVSIQKEILKKMGREN
jgi:elongation factor G